MTIKNFIAEFKAENDGYVSQGLIDEISLWKWIIDALKPFGMNIMQRHETVVRVFNNRAELPENFYSLKKALYCTPRGYYSKKPLAPQFIMTWVEKSEVGRKWDSCDPCCFDTTEKLIKKKLYIDNDEVDFYYHKPIPVKLGRTIRKDFCATDCYNKVITESPYEITIDNKTLKANFKDGDVYIKYWGIPTDDDGIPIIPDIANGEIEKYVEYYVYKKLYEKILRTKADDNVITLFNYYVGAERDQRFRAVTASKFAALTKESFQKLKVANRVAMLKYETNF